MSTQRISITQALITPSRPGVRSEDIGIWELSGRDETHGRNISLNYGPDSNGVRSVILDNGRVRANVLDGPNNSIESVLSSKNPNVGWRFHTEDGLDILPASGRDAGAISGLGWIRVFKLAGNNIIGPWAGPRGEATFINNLGQPEKIMLPLHEGGFNTPPHSMGVSLNNDALTVATDYRQRLHAFGDFLEVISEVSLRLGEPIIQVKQTLSSHKDGRSSVNALYHLNQIIEYGARVVVPLKTIRARDNNGQPERFEKHILTVEELNPKNAEQVLYTEPFYDKDGNTSAMIVSTDGETAVRFRWNREELNFLTLWLYENTNAPGAAIEPGWTHSVGADLLNPNVGASGLGACSIPTLDYKEHRTALYTAEIIEGMSNVDANIEEVQSLAQGKETIIISEPFENQEAIKKLRAK